MLSKEDFQLNWGDSALTTHRTVMGLYPGAVTVWKERRLKVLATEPLIERLSDALTEDARALVGQWSTGAQIGACSRCIPEYASPLQACNFTCFAGYFGENCLECSEAMSLLLLNLKSIRRYTDYRIKELY